MQSSPNFVQLSPSPCGSPWVLLTCRLFRRPVGRVESWLCWWPCSCVWSTLHCPVFLLIPGVSSLVPVAVASPLPSLLLSCLVWWIFFHPLHLSQVLGILDHQPLCLFVLEPHFHGPRGWSIFWLHSCDLVEADFDVKSVYADFLHFLQVMFDSGFVVVRVGLRDTGDNDTFFPRVSVFYYGCRIYWGLGNFFQVLVNRRYLGTYFACDQFVFLV